MTLIIRKLDTKKWSPVSPDWLQLGDIEADPLGDLSTFDNALSVFVVEQESAVERVIAALIARQNSPRNVGYVLIDPRTLEELGFKIEEKQGTTPDDEVNEWHRNIIELSGNALVLLARTIRDECELKAMLPDDWEKALGTSYKAGYIEEQAIQIKNKETRQKIGLPEK